MAPLSTHEEFVKQAIALGKHARSQECRHAIFRWTWTGTNAGPGGTGKFVRIAEYQQYTIGSGGLIAESKGHSDETECPTPGEVRRSAATGALTFP